MRRLLLLPCALLILHGAECRAQDPTKSTPANRVSIVDSGAVADGTTLNTQKIQSAIDSLAANGGGTVVIPNGVFVSGALFLKPKVNLHLEKDAVLRCSTDMANFPVQRTRIEGHFEEKFNPALINADGCDGLRISGEGTLDGAGRPIWDQFWKSIKADKRFKNLDLPRARLCFISNSKDVIVEGITFEDSQFWNLHLYKNQRVTVQNVNFLVPDNYKQAPSTDGIDVDSSQDVTIKGCYFSVTDDCVAVKGSKGPDALEDKDSPPVERVRVSDCTFKRGHAVLTCGSEATIVRDVVVENCKVTGSIVEAIVHLKLRPDTPQTYENIQVRNFVLEGEGNILSAKPWTQYFDLKGRPRPNSVVRSVTISNVSGRFGSLGTIEGNPGQTEISDITLQNIDVQLTNEKLKIGKDVKNLNVEKVTVNGKPFAPPQ